LSDMESAYTCWILSCLRKKAWVAMPNGDQTNPLSTVCETCNLFRPAAATELPETETHIKPPTWKQAPLV